MWCIIHSKLTYHLFVFKNSYFINNSNTYYLTWTYFSIFFFLYIKFQFMVSAYDGCAHFHQTKTPIGFLCRWRLNLKFLIQQSKTLPVELSGTHIYFSILIFFPNWFLTSFLYSWKFSYFIGLKYVSISWMYKIFVHEFFILLFYWSLSISFDIQWTANMRAYNNE